MTDMCPDVGSQDERSARHIVPLGGGVDAATYLVRCPGRHVVVKLNNEGLEAEARALRAWKPYTSWVPDVLGSGTVPSTVLSTATRPVKYLVLTALVNDEGEVVETADQFLARSPAHARDVGRELGAELHALHQARCPAGFGNFADSPGAERTYATWSSYLEAFFLQHADYVRNLGIGQDQIEKACAFMHRCPYVDEGRYLHGDVSIRNIAVRGYDPIRISLFDPNPVSGDPSWDIAPMTNNVELNERLRRAGAGSAKTLTTDRELLAGFWETYPPEVAEKSLLTAQLVQAILQAQHREDALDRGEVDDLEVEVAHGFIHTVIDRMSA
jgi:fructosamine-3-kinase